MLTPTLGFAFLYLLGRPLKKLPVIDVESDYRPPRWVLPIFALGSIFFLSLAFSCSLFLDLLKMSPSDTDFLQMYEREIAVTKEPITEPLSKASIKLDSYDGFSTFEFFFNGYRIFSSEVNCLMQYQCHKPSQFLDTEFNVATNNILDSSLHNIREKYELPHEESILQLLVPGDNYLDIISSNSGIGDCSLRGTISLSTESSNIQKIFNITPASGKSSSNEADNIEFIDFPSYGNGETADPLHIAPYMTLSADPSYRVCERLHFKMNLAPTAIPANISDIANWSRWAQASLSRKRCEILNGAVCN
ncbi:hypothetical protein CCGE525_18470 [Rhizobium jaguaris]|uniref:Uncharacterized protein n=2 Tax=Rhizobium jaguaris TaxID=1312183 RepID=A0A387FWQ6_9HYPH|nr:hypothetical protein CCGE525_18470 [Rhizobium jaguaris]